MIAFINLKRQVFIVPTLLLTVGLASCGGGGGGGTTGGGATGGGPVASGNRVSMTGAGASFPAPLYQRWFFEYNRNVNPNVQITYQSIGSGAGIEQFTTGTVDFGASDVAMTDDQIAKVKRGVVLLPMTAGSIVLGYNLPDLKELKLSRQNLADIYLGKITKWNDPALAKNNPGVTLPDEKITVVFRSDGSGTTGVFTKHMSAISPEWKSKVGQGTAVQWPVGIGARGNEGVTAQILQVPGAIGYIEFGFAKKQNISTAVLENKSGNFVPATPESSAAALAAVELPENLRAFIDDPEGKDSYPIVTYSWILANKTDNSPEKLEAFKGVMAWSLDNGQKIAEDLGYIPLPAPVVERVKKAMETMK